MKVFFFSLSIIIRVAADISISIVNKDIEYSDKIHFTKFDVYSFDSI